MLPAPRVRVHLLDAQTGVSLHYETVDGTITFKGSSGKEFYISVEVERKRIDDQRVFTVVGNLDGNMIGYTFHLEKLEKQVCVFDGFPTKNGCGRSMFKFNDMMVGSSNANNDAIGTISIDVYERGEIFTGALSHGEAKSAPREGTEKPHAKFFENQRLSTVGGSVVDNKYAGGLSAAYTCGERLTSVTIRYDDSTHVSLRASEQKKRKSRA